MSRLKLLPRNIFLETFASEMPQSFVWVEYIGFILAHTENGGVGIAKELDLPIEIWLPDTAIKEITYDDHGDSPNILLRKRFKAMRIESKLAKRKRLL